ncbi:MAG: tRNA (adenosine(37)-N6)-threonylcarbamoyltransferase complex ATPase subunit type 1 TsaE [Bdellovibrionales bacterium]|nr:tRNA (adenosine(37)-N6)-threonylcarbamoyltransferase complex ATPase subunit type 1 TsaE [Bdellovibrionales bacterium]
MPSKKSKEAQNRPFLWNTESDCSEKRLTEIAGKLALDLKPSDRVILDGEMGAGKSTFARALLQALGFELTAEGSPSFAIAHEYQRKDQAQAIHMDLYRLESEEDLFAAGTEEMIWKSNAWVLTEWLSKFPTTQKRLFGSKNLGFRVWWVKIIFSESRSESPETRNIRIERLG